MSEPQETNDGSLAGHHTVPQFQSEVNGVASSAPIVADDTPTIISRPVARLGRPEDAFADTLRGRRLAHYELIEPIGVGGMAAVIRARDTQLDRIVALKILPPDMAVDPENIKRFQQEARAAARLDHENIARVFYYGEDQGLHFIAFEFVEGENLRAILEKRGRLSVPETVDFFRQIAEGLAHSAERGVVHRDIKPSNIIVSSNGQAKLVDMGLARSQNSLGPDDLTRSGVTLGTFDYISPEQALEPREADVRSDIYSLGCTFYQVLTGQSPVPDGTAAKKLHHHQHVQPIDPRQLNSEIPDDLAAILACMMAKDPAHRYQQPTVLVDHLRQLSRRLGLVKEVRADPRAIVIPLHRTHHGMRPTMLAVTATTLMVLIAIIHAMASRNNGNNSTERSANKTNDQKDLDAARSKQSASESTTSKEPALPQAELNRVEIQTARELNEQLLKKLPRTHLLIAKDIDLLPEKPILGSPKAPGLIFDGGPDRELTIEAKEPGRAPVIRIAHDNDVHEDDRESLPIWAALTVRGGKVTLRNLRFEVDAARAEILMTALRVREGSVVIERCEFIQLNPPATDRGRLSSILVESSRNALSRPQVDATGCFFGRGRNDSAAAPAFGNQDAVTISGVAAVTLTSCSFGPHANLVHARERSSAEIKMLNCSAMLVDGTALQIDDQVSGQLAVRNSLFSLPEEEAQSPTARAVLVHLNGRAFGGLSFQGQGNRYHNLSALCVKDKIVVAHTVAEFARAEVIVVSDERSDMLTSSPWRQKNPLQELDLNQPQQAFALNVTMKALRSADRTRLVGIDQAPWGQPYGVLPALDDRALHQVVKTVDPSQNTDPAAGIYKTLSQAIPDVKPGDTILIRFNGLVPAALNLEKASLDLTVKAAPGYHPILTLEETSDPDVSLFRVHDGKLRFERLEILLKSRQRDFKEAQTIVGLAGVGHCTFKDCTITLDAENSEASLSVVGLADPNKVMSMKPDSTPAREMPELRFENCFIRGRGDMVSVRASRAFDLRAENCLVALAGCFISIDSNSKEIAVAPASQLALNRVTTYLTGNLMLLRTGKTGKELVPTQVRSAMDCLFVSAGGESLIHFDGEVTEQSIKRLVSWEGRHNVYSNFKHLLDQQPRALDDMSLAPFDSEKWETSFSGEKEPIFQRVRLANTPLEGGLSRSSANQFKVRSETDTEPEYGVDISRLPKHADKIAPTPSPDQ